MLGRKALLVMVFKLISSVLGLVALFFITRYLGPGPYGTIAWTFALLAAIDSLADLGFDSAHIKRISEGYDINECLSTYAFIKLALIAVVVAVTLGGLLVWTVILNEKMVDTSVSIILIFLAYFVLYDVANIATTTYDAKTETAKTQIIVLTDIVIRTVVIIFVAINRLDVTALAMAYLIGAIGVFTVAMMFLRRSGFRFSKPKLTHSYVIFAIPLALSTLVVTVNGNIDRVLIGYFNSNVDVGYFSGIQAVSALLMVIGSAVSIMTFPTFSRMHKEGNFKAIREYSRTGERYISMIAMPIVAVILVFPTATAMVLLGPTFKGVDSALQVLMITTLLTLVNMTYTSQITALNRPDLILKLSIVSFVTYGALLIIFIPTSILGIKLLGMSFYGATIAGLIATIVNFVLVRTIVNRLSNTVPYWRIVLHVVSISVTVFALMLISHIWTVTHWYDLLGVGLCSIAVFMAVLTLTGEFKKKDLAYALDVLNVKQMGKYLKEEVTRRN